MPNSLRLPRPPQLSAGVMQLNVEATMEEVPKRIKRLIREQAAEAHEQELRRALVGLAEQFHLWESGQISSDSLNTQIHEFHDGPSRHIFNKYNQPTMRTGVAHAIASGILDRSKIPPELLEHLATAIEFFESEEASS